MIIIGITGGIGHGKTTFAQYLASFPESQRHWETSEVVCEVANGLRQNSIAHPAVDNLAAINKWLGDLPAVLRATVHVDPSFQILWLTVAKVQKHPEHYEKLFDYLGLMQRHPELQAVEITPENKSEFRSLLQWLGGYLVKVVGSGVWYDEIVRRIHVAKSSGIELATVGGLRFPGDAERLRNAGGTIVEIRRSELSERFKQDLTERERPLIKADTTVYNDGSLMQLKNCAAILYEDIRLRQLKPSYHAVKS